MDLTTITIVLGGITVIFLTLWKWIFSYWQRSGLECMQSNFFEPPGVKVFNAYNYLKSRGQKHGGVYLLFNPVYIPVDLDIVKNIVATDFNHFINRGLFKNPEPILNHLVNMVDEEWKNMRAKLTPTFTSGKMKMMFQIMLEKTTNLVDVLDEQRIINEPLDIKEVLSRFTTDIIGSVIFGIECNSLKTPDSEFRKFGKQVLQRVQKFILLSAVPSVFLKMFRIKIIPYELESYFVNIVDSTIKYREKNHVFRKDFMQLLLQLKHHGKVIEGDDERMIFDKNNSGEHLTLMQIAAQSILFFAAGYETSASTMTFAMLELAQHQDIQDKLRDEIKQTLKEHNGIVSYDAIMKMEYLDKVVQETLRKHPPAQLFPRICNKDYPVPGTNYVIKKGQQIMLPFRAIHHDAEHWPDPEKFDPERFSPENKAKRHRYAYLPFGEGPRMCIGSRFGLLQSKTGIATIINKFRVTLSDRNSLPIEMVHDGFLSAIKGILWINVEAVE